MRHLRSAAHTVCAMLPAAILCACQPGLATQRPTTSIVGPETLPDGNYTLVVHGMSCPKCISNVEMQLARIKGIVHPAIDMKHGFVRIDVEGGANPSKNLIASAIADSGFTLVEIRGSEQ